MWNRNKTLGALMLAATLGAASAAAQTMPRSQTVQQVAISVVDPASGREVDLIERGEDLELALGQEVRLELVDPTVTRRQWNIPGSFEIIRPNTGLELRRENVAQGTVLLRARALQPGDERREEIGWRVRDNVRTDGDNLRWGRLHVDIAGDTAQGSGSMWQASADRVIAGLYHGILLRAPDSGAAGYRDTIARDGWSGARRVAREIAESRESELGIYEKGSCNQARLLEMYEHLLGIDPNRVDQRRWREQLQRLERGDIAGVVDELVQTREFAARFGLS